MSKPWVEKRDDGRWVIRWRDASGAKQFHAPEPAIYHKAIAKKEADRFWLERGHLIPPPKVRSGPRPVDPLTLIAAAEAWRGLHAKLSYADDMLAVAQLCAADMAVTHVGDIQRDHIRAYRKAGHPESRLRKLRVLLNWAKGEHQSVSADALAEIPDGETTKAQEVETDWEYRQRTQNLTETEYAAILEVADEYRQTALVHCLSLYGWRPISANLQLARHWHLDEEIPFVELTIKLSDEPHAMVLFPETVDLMRPYLAGLSPGDPVFRDADGRPWKMDYSKAGKPIRAQRMSMWYWRHCRPLAMSSGGIYALKRYALTAMHEGRAPWKHPLSNAGIQLFTGQKDPKMPSVYLRTNLQDAARLLGHGSVSSGQSGQVGKTGVRMHPDAGQNLAQVIQFPLKSCR